VRLLADENCDPITVAALRKAGHDVSTIREVAPGASDETVIERALNEDRVVLTEDKGFGVLFYNRSPRSAGVILIKGFRALSLQTKSAAVVDAVGKHGNAISGKFVVVEPKGIRLGGRSGD
jgi:hypothetical protein